MRAITFLFFLKEYTIFSLFKKYGEESARDLYELCYEDDETIEPTPKLAQGAPLPVYYHPLFPKELANVPLCDIDPYYCDKLTFIVIEGRGAPGGYGILRYSATPSFFLFSPFHPCRRLALLIFSHWVFDYLIMITILANCYVMLTPETAVTNAVEIIFTSIYTFEIMVKLCARGLFISKYPR